MIVWFVCILVLVIRHTNSILYAPSSSTIPFHSLVKGRPPGKKKYYWTHNVCLDFLYQACLKHFALSEECNGILS